METLSLQQNIESQTSITHEEKKCPKCGRTLPLTEFYKENKKKDSLTCYCKNCCKQINKTFYINNPEYFKKYKEENRDQMRQQRRECTFLNRPNARTGGYLRGTGICLFCGEINPFKLELHHLFGSEHTLLIHLCANCHIIQHRFKKMMEITI